MYPDLLVLVLSARGSLLWMVDFRIPFVSGAGLSIISLGFVQQIRTKASGAKVLKIKISE